jgi:molybdenum cofactor biosynthesis enzyme MoaA
MCIHSLGHRPFAEMSEETFSRILGYVDEMRVPSVSLCFTNEPLLDSRIIKFVEKASALDCVVDVMLTTNATLLDEEMSKRLLDSGLLRLWISFDAATKETYEKIRVGG